MRSTSTLGFAELEDAFVGVETREQGFAVTCRLAEQLGFEHVIYAPVNNHPDAEKNWTQTSYPLAWREMYIAKKHRTRNPVRQKALVSASPFLWSELASQVSPAQREIFEDCRAVGMVNGYVVPVHGPWGQAVAVGFACQTSAAAQGPGLLVLSMLAQRLYLYSDQREDATQVQLTRREREVLQLLALGLSNPDVSDKLCISDNSVEWHLKNIFRKLAVSNRTAAVVKAIQLGGVF